MVFLRYFSLTGHFRCRGTGPRVDAALRRDQLTLTGLLKRAGRSVMDEGSIPCVQTDKSRLMELKMNQRKRRRELIDARCVSSVSVEAVVPLIDLVDPALKRISEKADTWRTVISEHVSLLSSAVGTNRKIGGKAKALVR